MQITFPSLDHRASAPRQANLAPPADPFGEEPRTAGPPACPYVPEADTVSFSHAMDQTAPVAKPDTGPSFGDFLDMINPLQHIPLVNMIYRSLTGDEIGAAAQIVGGAIFGGPIGAVGGTVSAIVQEQTGESVADAAFSALSGTPHKKAHTYADLNAPVTKTYNFNRTA